MSFMCKLFFINIKLLKNKIVKCIIKLKRETPRYFFTEEYNSSTFSKNIASKPCKNLVNKQNRHKCTCIGFAVISERSLLRYVTFFMQGFLAVPWA